MAGFEPAAPRAQGECATKLRYIPSVTPAAELPCADRNPGPVPEPHPVAGRGQHPTTSATLPPSRRQGFSPRGGSRRTADSRRGSRADRVGWASRRAPCPAAMLKRRSRNSSGVAAARALPTRGRRSSARVWLPHQLTRALLSRSGMWPHRSVGARRCRRSAATSPSWRGAHTGPARRSTTSLR